MTSPFALNDSIDARLDRLEQSNRRLRLALGGTATLGAAALLAGWATNNNASQGVQREIQTQRLVVVGADNQPRVMLAGNVDGSSLFLYGLDQPKEEAGGDQQNTGSGGVAGGMLTLAPRMRLMVEGDECKIELLQPGGTARAILKFNEEGPALQLLDDAGNPIEQ